MLITKTILIIYISYDTEIICVNGKQALTFIHPLLIY